MAKWRLSRFPFLCSIAILLALSFYSSALAQVKSEVEPNDKREQAQEVRVGDSIRGIFQVNGDYDYFRFVLEGPGKTLVQIDLSAVPGVQEYLYLYNDQGGRIWDVNGRDPLSIFNLALPQGIFYAAAWGDKANLQDKYTLALKSLGPWKEGMEAEPNDRREQAQEIRLGENIGGGVQQNNDDDWYKLAVDKPGKNYLQVDLSAVLEIDTYLYLYDANGQRLVEVNEAAKNAAESIARFPVESGFYYVRIYLGGKATQEKYTLTTKITGLWQEGWEFEPNDSRERANDLKLGQSVQGYFDHKRDEDYYELTIDAPGKTLIQIDLSAVPEVNGQIQLYNDKRRTLWSVNDTEKNGPESIFNLALAQGVYYVNAWAHEANTKDPYTLSAKILGPWQEGMEAEPNDRKEEATELRLGQSVEGYFHSYGDEDYFKLNVETLGKNNLQVDLSAVPGSDGRFWILDQGGNQLWFASDGAAAEPESVPYFTVTPGVYYILVRGYQRNITDKYTLTARLLEPWQEGTEAEPNDDLKQANEIKLDAPFTGRINAVRDIDYFLLNVPVPGVDLMIMQLSGIPGLKLSLEQLDSKANRLDHSWQGETGEGEEIIKMKFKPGTYYFRTGVRNGRNTGAEYILYAGTPQKPPATPEEVEQALIKALDWLALKQQKSGSWSGYEEAFTGLSLMAYIGAKCVQKDYSVNIQGAINYLKLKYRPTSKFVEGSKDAAFYGGTLGTGSMYEHAIATLGLIEALVDLNDSSLEPIAQDAINLIVRSQNTEHKPETLGGPFKPDSRGYGGWRYAPDSTNSDLSVSGWQILTLKAAVNAGFAIPDYAFPAAAGFVRSLQGKKDGSFLYESPGDYGSSCARAGMGALSLQLSGFPQDPAVPPALRFMQDYAPRWNIEQPGGGYPFYYWYYGTRAMFLAGGDDWQIWKNWMCRFLVDHQNGDGSWNGTANEQSLDTYRVALGALMLEFCCGHVPIYMSPVKRLGTGFIKVDFEKGAEKEASKNVEIIMDASNSMWGQIGGEAKITIARKVLAQIINGLPDSMNVGLRVYGHRYGLNDKLACTDTQLLVPIGPVAKTQLIDTINKIQLKGKTPLVLSVLEAIKDFEKIPNGSVILVTDGIESCNGDIKSIGPAVKKSGLELKVHIVGFDIKEKEARAELEAIAKSTEGRYLDAKNAGELLSALEQTLKLEYVVLNEKGEEAGRGAVGGDEVKLKEGTYTLRIMLAPEPIEMRVEVKAGGRSVCVLKKEAGAWKLGC
jgi:hypothetical protein